MKVLTICIPTYNNINVLEKEVKEYLSLKDSRLGIKVNDNASSDQTESRMRDLFLKNDSLIYNRNDKNLGIISNWILALLNANSEYVLFTLDKDLANIEELPRFIDYIEREKPQFGYVNLDINAKRGYTITKAGVENVCKMAYLSKHPSGYFYRSELLYRAFESEAFTKVGTKCDFPFEIINGELAVVYDSTIVNYPVVINANIRTDIKNIPHPQKSLSYNADNIWYGAPVRIRTFSYYLDNAIHLNLSLEERLYLINILLERNIDDVTTTLRFLMLQKAACDHYNLQPRRIGFWEMDVNLIKSLKTFVKVTSENLPFGYIFSACVKKYLKYTYRIANIAYKGRNDSLNKNPLSA